MSVRPGAVPPVPGTDDAAIIFMGGAVAYWWNDRWNTPAHYEYMQWRNDVRIALIAGGYLTYAHYEAWKGTWNPRAQAINNFALASSDLFLIMTPEDIESPGTDEEITVAQAAGIPIVRCDSSMGLAVLLPLVAQALDTAAHR
jgi:hypothetical protein